MSHIEYFVIYAISKDLFRVVADKETQHVQFYSTYQAAREVKDKLARKNPHVHYHIRSFNLEEKFIKEMEGNQ